MLSIIIVNYNEKEMLKVCLKGIVEARLQIDHEIIIVDNGSKDGSHQTLSELEKKIKNLKIIFNKKNVGFGAGCNNGIEIAQGEYILILNPDIAILPDSIEAMLEYMERNKKIGVLGPQLLDPDKTIQKSSHRYPAWYIPILRRTFFGKFKWARKKLDYYTMTDFNHQETKEVDWLLGAALMIRKEIFKKSVFFDERFFLYFEDIDLCRRAKVNGWQVCYFPQAKMFHYYQRSSAGHGLLALFSKITWIHIVSAIKYFWKWRKT